MRLLDAARVGLSAFSRFRRSELDARSAMQLLATWQQNAPQYPPFSYEAYADSGYRKNELIYACVREIATSASEPALRVLSRTPEGIQQEIIDHPLRLLIENPNEDLTEYEFWELVLTLLNVSGNCYIWKERSEAGRPIALWTLRPDRVKIWSGKSAVVDHYTYQAGDTVYKLPKRDVVHFKFPDPADDFYGLSPIRVCLRNTVLDNSVTDYAKVFFENAAVPYGLIKVKRRLENQNEAKRLREKWKQQYSGVAGWHAPAILDEDAEYKELGSPLDRVVTDALRNIPETRICMVFGVPPIIVGANVGLMRSTYSNYREARASFWDETLIPTYKRLAARLNKTLMPEFPMRDNRSRVFAKFDLSEVSALLEDQDLVWRRAAIALRAGGITVNMFLRHIGEQPVANGDVFLRSSNVDAVAAEGLTAPPSRQITHLEHILGEQATRQIEEAVNAGSN